MPPLLYFPCIRLKYNTEKLMTSVCVAPPPVRLTPAELFEQDENVLREMERVYDSASTDSDDASRHAVDASTPLLTPHHPAAAVASGGLKRARDCALTPLPKAKLNGGTVSRVEEEPVLDVKVAGITFRKLTQADWLQLRSDNDSAKPRFNMSDSDASEWQVRIEEKEMLVPGESSSHVAHLVYVDGLHVGFLPRGWVHRNIIAESGRSYKPDTARVKSIGTYHQQFVWLTLRTA